MKIKISDKPVKYREYDFVRAYPNFDLYKSKQGFYECFKRNKKIDYKRIEKDTLKKFQDEEIKRKQRTILQCNLENDEVINEYKTMSEASRETGISVAGICFCCNGKYKHAGGYKWKYSK